MPSGSAIPASDAPSGPQHDGSGGGDLRLAAVAEQSGQPVVGEAGRGRLHDQQVFGRGGIGGRGQRGRGIVGRRRRDRGDARSGTAASRSAAARASAGSGRRARRPAGCGWERHEAAISRSPAVSTASTSATLVVGRPAARRGRGPAARSRPRPRSRSAPGGRRSRCAPPRTRRAWRRRRPSSPRGCASGRGSAGCGRSDRCAPPAAGSCRRPGSRRTRSGSRRSPRPALVGRRRDGRCSRSCAACRATTPA